MSLNGAVVSYGEIRFGAVLPRRTTPYDLGA